MFNYILRSKLKLLHLNKWILHIIHANLLLYYSKLYLHAIQNNSHIALLQTYPYSFWHTLLFCADDLQCCFDLWHIIYNYFYLINQTCCRFTVYIFNTCTSLIWKLKYIRFIEPQVKSYPEKVKCSIMFCLCHAFLYRDRHLSPTVYQVQCSDVKHRSYINSPIN